MKTVHPQKHNSSIDMQITLNEPYAFYTQYDNLKQLTMSQKYCFSANRGVF